MTAAPPLWVPHLAMIGAVVFWSTIYVAAKSAVSVVPVAEAVALRFVIGAGALWLIALVRRLPAGGRGIAGPAFVAGFLEPGFASILVFYGLTLTTAVSATVIFAMLPLVSLTMGRIFLGEKIAPRVVAGALLALVGTTLLVWDDGDTEGASLLGDAVVAVALLFIAGVQLVLRRLATSHGQPVVVTAWQLTGSAACGLVFIPVMAPLSEAFGWTADAGPGPWLVLAYIGVMVSAMTFLIYNFALRHLPVGRVSLYYTLVAPLGVPFAAVVLGEPVTAFDIAATVLVFAAVALPALPGRKAPA